jgi:hypothetical protein
MTSAANVMNDYPAQTVMDTEKYLELIVQYVALASSLLSFFIKNIHLPIHGTYRAYSRTVPHYGVDLD